MTFAIKRQTSPPPPFNGTVFHFPFSKHTEKGLKTPVFVAEESLMALETPSPLNSKCHEKFPLFLSPSLNLPNMIIYQIWNIPNCSNTHPPNPKPHHTMFKIQIHTSNISPITNIFKANIHHIQNPTKHQSVHDTNTPNSKSHQAPICSATLSVSHLETVGCLGIKF